MSLLEVARVAGVSPSTVSRAINRPESLSTEKLVAVRKAMTAVNYTPLPPGKRRGPKMGASLARKAPATYVGLWCVGPAESQARNYYSSQLELLHFAVAESRMELKLVFSSADAVPPELLDGSVGGFILQGVQPTAKALSQIAEIPHVWLMTRRSESWPGDYVEPDNNANGRMAADWLASQKARRWAVVATEPGYPAYVRRREAFLHRAAELGIPVDEIMGDPGEGEDHLSLNPDAGEADALAKRFLGLRSKVDGVYMPGHGVCGPFFRALRQRGKDPAAFRTILGHYSPQVYNSLDPQPAAIDINLRAIVRHAVAQLADRIKNPQPSLPAGLRIAPFLRGPENC